MKSNKALIVFMAVSLIGGLLAGYGIWGTKEKKGMDVGQLLRKALKGVEIMEKKNRDLTAQLEESKANRTAAEALTKENQTLKSQLLKARDDRKELENRAIELNAKLAEAEKRGAPEGERKASDGTLANMAELEKENKDLREQLQQARQRNTTMESHLMQVRDALSDTEEQVKAGEELKTLSADLQTKVTALEAENARLKAILEKIDAITKGNEEPAKTAE